MHSSKKWIASAWLWLAASTALASPDPSQGTWESTLLPRDINGDGVVDAFYDTALNISWLRDTNYAMTSGYNSTGAMTYTEAVQWVKTLSIYGISGWRLPNIAPKNAYGFVYGWTNNASTDEGVAKPGIGWGTRAELGHLTYVALAQQPYYLPNDAYPQYGAVNPAWAEARNTGDFVNFQPTQPNWWTYVGFWYGNRYQPERYLDDRPAAWCFSYFDGNQRGCWGSDLLKVLPVYEGDVGLASAPVPELGNAIMLGAGLLGLLAVTRRQKRT